MVQKVTFCLLKSCTNPSGVAGADLGVWGFMSWPNFVFWTNWMPFWVERMVQKDKILSF